MNDELDRGFDVFGIELLAEDVGSRRVAFLNEFADVGFDFGFHDFVGFKRKTALGSSERPCPDHEHEHNDERDVFHRYFPWAAQTVKASQRPAFILSLVRALIHVKQQRLKADV